MVLVNKKVLRCHAVHDTFLYRLEGDKVWQEDMKKELMLLTKL